MLSLLHLCSKAFPFFTRSEKGEFRNGRLNLGQGVHVLDHSFLGERYLEINSTID